MHVEVQQCIKGNVIFTIGICKTIISSTSKNQEITNDYFGKKLFFIYITILHINAYHQSIKRNLNTTMLLF